MTAAMLSLRLDAATLHLVDAAAESSGRSRSEVVREALRTALGAPRALAPIDVVGDRVGCADSGRGDLATRHSSILKERLRAGATRSR
jgi:metal-responsive CopG/Arc/MetJ family transcriptional regulator